MNLSEPNKIERDIQSLRGELDSLIDELGRRGTRTVQWWTFARRYARPAGYAAALLIGAYFLRRLRPRPVQPRWRSLLASALELASATR